MSSFSVVSNRMSAKVTDRVSNAHVAPTWASKVFINLIESMTAIDSGGCGRGGVRVGGSHLRDQSEACDGTPPVSWRGVASAQYLFIRHFMAGEPEI